MKIQTLKEDGICIQIYSFELMDSRMYMIREDDEIFVVDPCIEDELLQDAKGAKKAVVFLTHEHYDHISGVNWLREHFSCYVYASGICAERVESEKDNLSFRFPLLFLFDREKYNYVRHNFSLPYTCSVEKSFCGKGEILWKGHQIELYEVGGHSPGSSLIVFNKKFLFGGDNILDSEKKILGIDGNPKRYQEVVVPLLQKFEPHMTVLPGHGEKKLLGYFLKTRDILDYSRVCGNLQTDVR